MGEDWDDLVDALNALRDVQKQMPDNGGIREAIGSIALTLSKMARLHEAALAAAGTE